jgi:hypothetical protein
MGKIDGRRGCYGTWHDGKLSGSWSWCLDARTYDNNKLANVVISGQWPKG